MDALQLLHSICDQYKTEAERFYMNSRRLSAKYSFKELSKRIFDSLPLDAFPSIYIELFDMISHMGYGVIQVARQDHVFAMPISLLLVNLIISYQLPTAHNELVQPDVGSNEGNEDQKDTKSRRKRRSNNKKPITRKVMMAPRVTFDLNVSVELMKRFLPVKISAESKLWKQIRYVLVPSGNQATLKVLAEVVCDSIKEGTISFSALVFCMQDPVISPHIERPDVILFALYIGPLSANTVEQFAMNRSEEFRARCREVLRSAVQAQRDPLSFKVATPNNLYPGHLERRSYRDFAADTTRLLRDLNGEFQGEKEIHVGWACAALQKYGRRTYVDMTWQHENFYDLIWTILAQRPSLKRYVCDLLEKKFNDLAAANFWRRMRPHQMDFIKIHNKNIAMINPLDDCDGFLNFPKEVQKIEMVSTDSDLERLHHLIVTRAESENTLLVGLDAEWSSYVSYSSASILQMALRDSVFIIDIESRFISHTNLKYFLTMLFENKNILKIGFQFGEDLHQLRCALRSCPVLYHPERVVCIGRIITELLEKLETEDVVLRQKLLPFMDVDLKGVEVAARDVATENVLEGEGVDLDLSILSEDAEESKEDGENNSKGPSNDLPQPFMNKGLAVICEKMLGKPLDKTEQCSVWNRRPLRPLQMRYAAMDAYCMLMLFDECERLARGLKVDFCALIDKQPPIRVSLPLLSGGPL
ncbi:unnamed protein product [Caenorhabditis auriculariae]|uniref:3'-5' exonuclease domain-containing protein n=1 Tax=Caenorhabditis auriculariae TaxID=2777116 RepID=A0A8S1HR56_9PELO|nr:unnamed protein product [Caenorhabditis auriculariae]